jgi:hypothetical protein
MAVARGRRSWAAARTPSDAGRGGAGPAPPRLKQTFSRLSENPKPRAVFRVLEFPRYVTIAAAATSLCDLPPPVPVEAVDSRSLPRLRLLLAPARRRAASRGSASPRPAVQQLWARRAAPAPRPLPGVLHVLVAQRGRAPSRAHRPPARRAPHPGALRLLLTRAGPAACRAYRSPALGTCCSRRCRIQYHVGARSGQRPIPPPRRPSRARSL